MSRKCLINSLAALATAVTFVLPAGSALAESYVTPSAVVFRLVIPASSPDREAYFAMKEAQLDRADASSGRSHRVRPVRQTPVSDARSRYAAFKDAQMVRFMGGQ